MIKKILVLMLAMVMVLPMGAEAKEKKVKTKKLANSTYVQPGSQLLDKGKSGNFRAWAVGKSSTEMAARTKAKVYANAQLAEMVEVSVKNLLQFSATELSEDEKSTSMSVMTTEFIQTSQQSLKGAKVIFDEWGQPDADGYSNYIVLELNGSDLFEAMFSAYMTAEKDAAKKQKINKAKIKELFYEQIKANSK
ncbi:MAG: hypothetical protein R3Y16_04270 [Rikenellaceae bacterium]